MQYPGQKKRSQLKRRKLQNNVRRRPNLMHIFSPRSKKENIPMITNSIKILQLF